MLIDPAIRTADDIYKLLTNLIVPRPIAWVTSRNEAGLINLAPFSFFNAIGNEPPYLLLSIAHHDDGTLKDSARNILSCGEFVVNLVTEELLDAMNLSAADFPPDESELEAAGLEATPSQKITVPRVAKAQVALECVLHSHQSLGGYELIIGQVVMMHVADHLVGPGLHIHGFEPVGRLGSPSMYCHTKDRFDLPRIRYADWKQGGEHGDNSRSP